MITFVNQAGGTYTATVLLGESSNSYIIYSDPYGLATLRNVTVDDVEYTYLDVEQTFSRNNDSNSVLYSYTIVISTSLFPDTYDYIFEFVQAFTSTSPVWKDKIINFPVSETGIEFNITKSDNTVLYSGTSYKYNSINSIKINNIISQYLNGSVYTTPSDLLHIDFSTNGWQDMSNAKMVVNINIVYNESEYLLGTCNFYKDWSYINYDYPYIFYMSDPIFDDIDFRQYFLYSMTTIDDSTVNVFASVDGTSIMDTDLYDCTSTYVYDISDLSLLETRQHTINFNDYRTFTISNTCKKYCLYYTNARGGWDWMLIDGKHIQTNDYNRLNYNSNYDNTTVQFGNHNYINYITEQYELTTRYMTDEQSAKMYNIFGSTCVYLHDMENDIVQPVVIVDKSQTVKTFKNQNRKMYNYVIKVESSQQKIRM